ncbi:MAG: hypothetical protein M0D55_09340 [Elusimicrobiota bacterium]|nr:MAG: hypothetical protein M0D55_09340 [Elusimicrobiota bacterium]
MKIAASALAFLVVFTAPGLAPYEAAAQVIGRGAASGVNSPAAGESSPGPS